MVNLDTIFVEQIGVEIIDDLDTQRESLIRTRDRVWIEFIFTPFKTIYIYDFHNILMDLVVYQQFQ